MNDLDRIPQVTLTETQIAKKLWELEQQKKACSEELDHIKDEINLLSKQLMETLVTSEKNSTGFIEGVGNFALNRKSFLSVTKAHMPAFIEALKFWDQESIVKESVEPNTLKAFLEEKLGVIVKDLDLLQPMGAHDVLNYVLKNFPVAHEDEKFKALTVEEIESMATEKLAGVILSAYGVSVHQEIKLSHTQKGKVTQ